MATDRLKLYNGALLAIGRSRLASLTANEESRRLLDEVWNDGAIDWCLEQGMWKFATRTQMLDYDNTFTAEFGYRRRFEKATDWRATVAVCSDEFFRAPLTRYSDESGYIYSDIDRIYVKFVSNHADWGMNLASWPSSFTEFVKIYLAGKIAWKATKDKEIENEFWKKGGKVDRAMDVAKNNDAQDDPTKFIPPGNWVMSRRGMKSSWRDGGSRSRLIG